MLDFFKLLVGIKPKYNLPKLIEGHWYCGTWYTFLGAHYDQTDKTAPKTLNPDPEDVMWPPENGKTAFNHFRCGIHSGSDKTGLIHGLVPACRDGEFIGLYEVLRRYCKTTFYDGLIWDDGFNVDLKLVKVITLEEYNELRKNRG